MNRFVPAAADGRAGIRGQWHQPTMRPGANMTSVPENCDGPHSRGLTQWFGIRTAVDNVELLVSRGCEVGYAGPSGSVKTRLIRVLPGLTRAARGTVSLLGIPVRSRRSLALALVSAIAGESRLHRHLTEPENLKMLAVGHGGRPRQGDRPGARQDGAGPAARRQGLPSAAAEEGNTNHSSGVICQPRRERPPTPRTAAAVLAMVGLALLAAACGGSPSSTGSGGSPNAGGGASSPSAVGYSRCVRSHGVPNFPDPDSSGHMNKDVLRQLGVSAVIRAAEYACQDLNPANFALSPAGQREQLTG